MKKAEKCSSQSLTRLSPFGLEAQVELWPTCPDRETRQRETIKLLIAFGEHHFRLGRERERKRGLFVLAIRLANLQKASEDTICKSHLKPVQALVRLKMLSNPKCCESTANLRGFSLFQPKTSSKSSKAKFRSPKVAQSRLA